MSYPSYGSIVDSGRLLLNLQPNAAMLNEKEIFVRPTHLPDMIFSSNVGVIKSDREATVQPGILSLLF